MLLHMVCPYVIGIGFSIEQLCFVLGLNISALTCDHLGFPMGFPPTMMIPDNNSGKLSIRESLGVLLESLREYYILESPHITYHIYYFMSNPVEHLSKYNQ